MLLTFCCDVYHRNEKIGRLEIINGKLIKNEVYTDELIIHPFPRSTTFESITAILKERVICEARCDEFMLKSMGLDHYNVYDILRVTHGVDIDDFIWFKFDDEDITWEDVRVR